MSSRGNKRHKIGTMEKGVSRSSESKYSSEREFRLITSGMRWGWVRRMRERPGDHNGFWRLCEWVPSERISIRASSVFFSDHKIQAYWTHTHTHTVRTELALASIILSKAQYAHLLIHSASRHSASPPLWNVIFVGGWAVTPTWKVKCWHVQTLPGPRPSHTSRSNF